MAFCKNCGTDIGDANVCSACGAVQVAETPVVPVAAPVQETPSFSADPASYSATSAEIPVAPVSPVAGQSTSDAGSTVPTYTPSYSVASEEMPNTTGMVVFSIINIVLGLLFCCCLVGLSLVGTVLGIIALVFSIQAGKAATAEEAKQKLKTAKTMNIIAVIVSGAALIIGMIFNAASIGSMNYSDYMDRWNLSDYQ